MNLYGTWPIRLLLLAATCWSQSSIGFADDCEVLAKTAHAARGVWGGITAAADMHYQNDLKTLKIILYAKNLMGLAELTPAKRTAYSVLFEQFIGKLADPSKEKAFKKKSAREKTDEIIGLSPREVASALVTASKEG